MPKNISSKILVKPLFDRNLLGMTFEPVNHCGIHGNIPIMKIQGSQSKPSRSQSGGLRWDPCCNLLKPLETGTLGWYVKLGVLSFERNPLNRAMR